MRIKNETLPIPITFTTIFKTRKHRKITPIKVLVDSGASKPIIYKDKPWIKIVAKTKKLGYHNRTGSHIRKIHSKIWFV